MYGWLSSLVLLMGGIVIYLSGRAGGLCVMCIMQAHITQALSHPGDVIDPSAVISGVQGKCQPGKCFLAS